MTLKLKNINFTIKISNFDTDKILIPNKVSFGEKGNVLIKYVLGFNQLSVTASMMH